MSPVPVALDHCVIGASDYAVSDRFYAAVFGAEVIRPREDFRFYRIGKQQLNVHLLGADYASNLVARIPVAAGGSDLCFEWNGPIEDAIEHLSNLGIPLEAGPMLTGGARGSGMSVYFRDPDGSLLEFIVYA